jgi:hypothetical protein
VHEPKKQFYKRFLYEPFPVESSLPGVVGGVAAQRVALHIGRCATSGASMHFSGLGVVSYMA